MSKELGTLVVVVLKAKNLHDRHSFYKQDPYTKITLNGKTSKTEADVKGGQRPEWDAEFRFPVYATKNDASRQLEVACWRAEPREHEEIGKGKVDISETLKTGEFDDWVTINDVTGTYRGEVYLEMTFFASGPPPLERRPSKLPPQDRLQHLKRPSVAPTAGGNLAVPGGTYAHGSSPPKMDKPLPSPHETLGPAPLPSTLRPGSGHDAAHGQGGHSNGRTPPNNSRPPPSLTAGRQSAPPQQLNNSDNAYRIPGRHAPTLSGSGYDSISYSPPRGGYSPPRLSQSPPRQSNPEYNPYVAQPVLLSGPGSGFFPSPSIKVDPTPPGSAPYNHFPSGPGYSTSQHTPPRLSPPQPSPPKVPAYISTPNFPSVPPQHPPRNSYPPQSTSSYSPPQPTYPLSPPGYQPQQSAYPLQQPAYPPPSRPGYPVHAQQQFPAHYPSYPAQYQDGYPTHGHNFPAPGFVRPGFGREDSVGELPDPALAQKYSSPLPLPNDMRQPRTSSPFPVPSISPPHHPVPTPYSPSAEYEREMQIRREQEERDEEIARRLDLEWNMRNS